MNRRELLLDQFGIPEEESPLFADDLDDAIIGAVHDRWGTRGWRVVYDREKCIELIAKSSDSSLLEAEEFFEFNTEGAFVGESTPLFVEVLDVS